jgi:hypothetical protein
MIGDFMFSLYVMPVLLCLVPLTTALSAWHLSRGQAPDSPSLRIICFYCGVAVSIFTTLVTMSCFLDPFPLVHLTDGSESIGWLELAWKVAFGGAFLSIVLALFGKGWSRMLLALAGVMLVLLAFGSLLQNGV